MERTERFELRLSKEEAELLRKRASEFGMSAADYLRLLLRATLQVTAAFGKAEGA